MFRVKYHMNLQLCLLLTVKNDSDSSSNTLCSKTQVAFPKTHLAQIWFLDKNHPLGSFFLLLNFVSMYSLGLTTFSKDSG